MLDVDPAVPHHLVGEEAVLGQAHGVDLAAAAVVVVAAEVGVAVREDDVDPARADAVAAARPLAPVVVPAAHVLGRVAVLVAVVVGAVALVQRALVERRGEVVLELPRASSREYSIAQTGLVALLLMYSISPPYSA
jgi:hypothetical protein